MAPKKPARKPANTPSGGVGFWDLVKMGFATSIGFGAAQVLFLLVAVGLLAGGYVLVNQENKKAETDRSQARRITGLALMGLGVAIGGGIGASVFLGSLTEE